MSGAAAAPHAPAALLAAARLVRFVSRGLIGRDPRAPQDVRVEPRTFAGPAGPLPARLYVPPGAEAAPILLWLHGGGFVCCDLDTHDPLCRRLARASGLRIFAAGYRLAPEHPFPAQLDDAAAALEAALALAGGPVAVGGDSAGGWLAAALAGRAPGAVALQVLMQPMLRTDDASWRDRTVGDLRVVGRAAMVFIRLCARLERAPDLFAAVRPDLPPAVVIYGGLDPVGGDVRAYARALREAGVAVHEARFTVLPHAAPNLTGRSKAAAAAVARAGEAAGRAAETAFPGFNAP